MEPVQVLTPAGELRADRLAELDLNVTPELCRDLYRRMRVTRRLDEEAYWLQRQGELGLWLRSLGQEAAQVGSITAMAETDHVFASYREHAVALYRGITPLELLRQWRGNAHSGWDPARYRFHIYTLVLSAQLLHATGYAMGVQRDGARDVVLAYFGDGAASEGDANEAMVFAELYAAPVLFFCQNNQWAISTPGERQTRAPLYRRARALGLHGHLVDGNDALAVHAVTRSAATAVRDGGGPGLVEAVTYRMAGHSTSDEPDRYRDRSEVDRWLARDPVDRLERLLEREGWLDEAFLAAVAAEGDELAAQARRDIIDLAPPLPAELFAHVYTEATPELLAQRDRYQTYRQSIVDLPG